MTLPAVAVRAAMAEARIRRFIGCPFVRGIDRSAHRSFSGMAVAPLSRCLRPGVSRDGQPRYLLLADRAGVDAEETESWQRVAGCVDAGSGRRRGPARPRGARGHGPTWANHLIHAAHPPV